MRGRWLKSLRPITKDKTSWGQKPVPEIPVPPFASEEEGEKFFRMLGLYIALLDKPGSPVQPSTYAVVTLLEAGRNALRGVKEWPAPVDPAVFYLALTVFIPVPWTPHGLVAAMSAAPWDQCLNWELHSPDIISWRSDPRYEARRLVDGSWTVTGRERDHMSVLGTPRDDDVLLLAGRQRTHAYPFASQTNVPWMRVLEEAAAPFRASWSRHSELPYLAVFNSERSPAPPAPDLRASPGHLARVCEGEDATSCLHER